MPLLSWIRLIDVHQNVGARVTDNRCNIGLNADLRQDFDVMVRL